MENNPTNAFCFCKVLRNVLPLNCWLVPHAKFGSRCGPPWMPVDWLRLCQDQGLNIINDVSWNESRWHFLHPISFLGPSHYISPAETIKLHEIFCLNLPPPQGHMQLRTRISVGLRFNILNDLPPLRNRSVIRGQETTPFGVNSEVKLLTNWILSSDSLLLLSFFRSHTVVTVQLWAFLPQKRIPTAIHPNGLKAIVEEDKDVVLWPRNPRHWIISQDTRLAQRREEWEESESARVGYPSTLYAFPGRAVIAAVSFYCKRLFGTLFSAPAAWMIPWWRNNCKDNCTRAK